MEMHVLCMSVLRRDGLGAGSYMVGTGNASDRAGLWRMKVEEGRHGRGEDWEAARGG
jgi:hypothetical protein